jgi:hypothetical protein
MSLAVDPLTDKIAMTENGDVFGRSGLEFQEFNWNGSVVAGSYKSFGLPNGDAPYGEPSLAFLPDGTAHIAFQEGSAYGTAAGSAYAFLALVSRVGGTWGSPVTVDDAVQFTGAEPSLSLAGGTFHVAYQDATTFDLRYATSADATTWSAETVPATKRTGFFPSLALTNSGAARMSYYNTSNTSLRSVSFTP